MGSVLEQEVRSVKNGTYVNEARYHHTRWANRTRGTAGKHSAPYAAKHAAATPEVASATKAAGATLDSVTNSSRTYAVESGDDLAGIARKMYGNAGDWHWIYEDNTSKIANPNLIYPGQVLDVPSSAPAVKSAPAVSTSVSRTRNYHAASAKSTSHSSSSSSSSSAASVSVSVGGHSGALSGHLDCGGLEQLWKEAGGSPAEAFMAAEIAMAESGGNQYAVSPTADYGYWQINASHGSEATFNPLGNAEAAISISGDGANWSPWTTYTSGAYSGKC